MESTISITVPTDPREGWVSQWVQVWVRWSSVCITPSPFSDLDFSHQKHRFKDQSPESASSSSRVNPNELYLLQWGFSGFTPESSLWPLCSWSLCLSLQEGRLFLISLKWSSFIHSVRKTPKLVWEVGRGGGRDPRWESCNLWFSCNDVVWDEEETDGFWLMPY